jgi:hypothetical protein
MTLSESAPNVIDWLMRMVVVAPPLALPVAPLVAPRSEARAKLSVVFGNDPGVESVGSFST